MRTVFTVDPVGLPGAGMEPEKFMIKVEKHSAEIPLMKRMLPLDLPPLPGWDTPNAVAARGCLVRDALRKHPGIASVLNALETTPVGTRVPIYVKLSEGDAELIAWEMLCDQANKFIALDRRWPIGRVTDPASYGTRTPPLFRLPVRILAVISAFGVENQQQEWEALLTTADTARQAGLPVEIRVLSGSPDVHVQVASDIANARPWVSLGGLEASGAKVLTAITHWQPNIVHFFCHGTANDHTHEQFLELASRSDFEDMAVTSGSVTISGDQLVSFGELLDNPWLMVLNCCKGAQASREALSLAHRVASAAFPAAFAMLEPVDASDAHEFTEAIYGALFRELRAVETQLKAGQPVHFEWATLTHDARDALNSRHKSDAAGRREWALPALYVREIKPMEFRPAPANASAETLAAQKAALETIAEWLRSVKDSELSEERRKQAMADALTKANVPAALWPSVDGTFNA